MEIKEIVVVENPTSHKDEVGDIMYITEDVETLINIIRGSKQHPAYRNPKFYTGSKGTADKTAVRQATEDAKRRLNKTKNWARLLKR